MRALICGSVAFDNIMVFEDRFKNHILPDKIHMLSVSFLVPALRREFGGCAGNIGYNLNMLGGEPVIMAAVGEDFAPYREWLVENKLDVSLVREAPGTLTAQAFITTDLDDNQITAFHPGAMNASHENHVADAKDIGIGIIAPDGRDGMVQHAREFADAGIPFIFDPGQGMPMFDGDDLKAFIEQASYVTVNDYEWQLMQERTGLNAETIAEKVKALIVTRGGEGSQIYADGEMHDIPAAPIGEIADPTGCGDAYRAGLLLGLDRGFDWPTTGRIASLCGAIKIESRGTQNHAFTIAEFRDRYARSFGSEAPEL